MVKNVLNQPKIQISHPEDVAEKTQKNAVKSEKLAILGVIFGAIFHRFHNLFMVKSVVNQPKIQVSHSEDVAEKNHHKYELLIKVSYICGLNFGLKFDWNS